MSNLSIPIRKVLENPELLLNDENCFGFYDWFCSREALERKARSLFAKLKKIIGSSKINIDTMYVFFKNNCPMDGSLYDDFRICDIETGDVYYTITPKSGHRVNKGRSEVYSNENDFQTERFIGTCFKDVIDWFMEENARYAAIKDEDIPLILHQPGWSTNVKQMLLKRLKQ